MKKMGVENLKCTFQGQGAKHFSRPQEHVKHPLAYAYLLVYRESDEKILTVYMLNLKLQVVR